MLADINNTDSMVAEMSSATKERVLALKTATSLKWDDARMRRHEKWMKMAAVYVCFGRQDKALEMRQKIEDDENNQRADSKESLGYHTPLKEQQEHQELQQPVANLLLIEKKQYCIE